MYYTCTVTVITQPNNVTGCVGGTAMFTCVIKLNVNMNVEDIRWWTIRNDHSTSGSQRLIVRTQGTTAFDTTSNINGETLSSVLLINGLRSQFIGPYWLGMADGTQLSDVGFLSIALSGMCIYIRI